jgi:hypothetical protein
VNQQLRQIGLVRVGLHGIKRKESRMSKREMMDEIIRLNRSAGRDFLEKFNERELQAYLLRISQARTINYLPQLVMMRHAPRWA